MEADPLEPAGKAYVSVAVQRVRRHSAVVRNLRLAVPAIAVSLAVTYALSATPPQVDLEFAEQFEDLYTDEDGVKLARPRYAGEDLEGQPFELAATTATRAQNDPSRVGLERPEARRVNESGEVMTVRAADGLYDEAAKLMDLTSDVQLEQSGRGGTFVLNTDAAQVDLDTQVVTSSAEVRGSGDAGTVRADRGTLYQNEDRLVLEGGVRISLAPKKADTKAQDGQTSPSN